MVRSWEGLVRPKSLLKDKGGVSGQFITGVVVLILVVVIMAGFLIGAGLVSNFKKPGSLGVALGSVGAEENFLLESVSVDGDEVLLFDSLLGELEGEAKVEGIFTEFMKEREGCMFVFKGEIGRENENQVFMCEGVRDKGCRELVSFETILNSYGRSGKNGDEVDGDDVFSKLSLSVGEGAQDVFYYYGGCLHRGEG